MVGFSNGSVDVHVRVFVKVDELEDKETVEIANKVCKKLRNSKETGKIGNLKVKGTFGFRGLCCGIDVVFVHSLIESFFDPLIC